MQKGSGKLILVVVLGIVIIGGGYWWLTQQDSGSSGSDATQPTEGVTPGKTVLSGELLDVTNGDTVRGLNTGGSASGTANMTLTDGEFILEAVFENLPEPQGTDFYEGWLVRREGEFSVVSSGRLTQEDDTMYSNLFVMQEDLTDHDFYVLTIEPDDGDPAPADHILEGELQ